jgi:hypothetical protein
LSLKSQNGNGTSRESALQFIKRYLSEQNRFLERYSSCYQLKQQSVLVVTGTRSDVTVTTSGFGPRQRRRYQLRKLDGAWKLTGIQLECSLCSGTRTRTQARRVPCVVCEGEGWTLA